MISKHLETVTGSPMMLTQRSTDGLSADTHALSDITDTYCGLTMPSFYWMSGCVI